MAAAICAEKIGSYGSHGAPGPSRWLKLAILPPGPPAQNVPAAHASQNAYAPPPWMGHPFS